jgi:deoxyribodipyrimidine photolyase
MLGNTLRAHDNPALDTALVCANTLGLPLLVLFSLSDTSIHSTARRHRFVLEAVADLQEELDSRKINFFFHLAQEGKRQMLGNTLAHRAAAVITEEPFVHPYVATLEAVARAAPPAPIFCVDTHCVVPCGAVRSKRIERAGTYEKTTAEARQAFLAAAPQHEIALDVHNGVASMGSLCSFPFGTLRITEANINEAIRSCDVDFSVAPVSHTRGGSRAGYARWNAFLASGLGSYNRTRNDPLKQHSNGVSRMSAFLNLGRLRVWHRVCCRVCRSLQTTTPQGSHCCSIRTDSCVLWVDCRHGEPVSSREGCVSAGARWQQVGRSRGGQIPQRVRPRRPHRPRRPRRPPPPAYAARTACLCRPSHLPHSVLARAPDSEMPSFGCVTGRHRAQALCTMHYVQLCTFRVYDAWHGETAPACRMQTWREISYHFCFNHSASYLRLADVLPAWAKQALQKHAADRRSCVMALERLASCESGDQYWDVAQRSLCLTGELHNNIRWGCHLSHY